MEGKYLKSKLVGTVFGGWSPCLTSAVARVSLDHDEVLLLLQPLETELEQLGLFFLLMTEFL